MTVVVDAALVAAALIDDGPVGTWADGVVSRGDLAAPHLMPVEVANILRRTVLAGDLSVELATLAHNDLLALRVHLYPYEPFAQRVWELRENVTAYDAWYVSLAERLEVDLATLDRRLARAPGPRCGFETTPE